MYIYCYQDITYEILQLNMESSVIKPANLRAECELTRVQGRETN